MRLLVKQPLLAGFKGNTYRCLGTQQYMACHFCSKPERPVIICDNCAAHSIKGYSRRGRFNVAKTGLEKLEKSFLPVKK